MTDEELSEDTAVYILCPFHNDTNRPSMRVYPDGAHCFTCGKHVGRREFSAMFSDRDICNTELMASLSSRKVSHAKAPHADPLVAAISGVKKLFDGSAESQRVIDYLNARGLDDDTIRNYQLGFNGVGISMPVWDAEKRIVTIRYRRWDGAQTQMPHKYWGLRGNNGVRLYPWPSLFESDIILTEGELDALLLRSYNLPAYSLTNGNMASIQRIEQFEVFVPQVRRFYLVRDQDEAGKMGTAYVKERLELLNARWHTTANALVQGIDWPLELGKDVTEMWQTHPREFLFLRQHLLELMG